MGYLFAAPSALEINLALGMETWSQDVHSSGISKRAVDGNFNPEYSANSCASTTSLEHAWWAVDLERSYQLLKVMVTMKNANGNVKIRYDKIRWFYCMSLCLPGVQIPQCTSPISHNAPLCSRNVHTYVCTFLLQNGALWDICPMHCGICGIWENFAWHAGPEQ